MNFTELIAQLDALVIDEAAVPTVSTEDLPTSPSVCYVYDEEMTLHKGGPEHPERPDRIRSINDHLAPFFSSLLVLPSRTATRNELLLVHTPELVDRIFGFASELSNSLPDSDSLVKEKEYFFPFDSDTYICHASPGAARLACGSVLNCVDTICSSSSVNYGFAAIRPPGHHASADKSSGYCLFNNVAVAAKYAQSKHGLKKVAILDWDVHHGNGTQEIFDADSSILFISIHRHDGGKFYPGTGHYSATGSAGRCVNLSIDGSFGDSEINYLFDHVIIPVLTDFAPELLLVSAGFDAAENDPLGGCRVRTSTFGTLTERLKKINPRMLLVLEGGYNLDSIAKSSVACMGALLGREIHCSSSPTLSSLSSPSSSIRSVRPEMVKTSVVRMAHSLTKLLQFNFHIPLAPALQKRFAPKVHHPIVDEIPLLCVSGGGHVGGVVREKEGAVVKETTVREALAYGLIFESIGNSLGGLLSGEKKRIGSVDLAALKQFVCECLRVDLLGGDRAKVELQDLTRGGELIGVLDVKLGTEYHTPEDGPGRVKTRRQKAAATSADSLGIRLTAGRMLEGFELSKRTAAKLKTLALMVPVVRRFLLDCDNKNELLDTACEWIREMKQAASSVRFIAASVLLVVTRIDGVPTLKCTLIDLAHMYPVDEDLGFALGCDNFIKLLEQAKDV